MICSHRNRDARVDRDVTHAHAVAASRDCFVCGYRVFVFEDRPACHRTKAGPCPRRRRCTRATMGNVGHTLGNRSHKTSFVPDVKLTAFPELLEDRTVVRVRTDAEE